MFKVLAGTGVDAATESDGANKSSADSKSSMRKALESIKHTSLDGVIELRLFCVEAVGQQPSKATQGQSAGADQGGSVDIREVVHTVQIPDAVLNDAKRAIAGQGELRSQAQWLGIAVKTVSSLLREIGEKVKFQLDPEVQRVLVEGGGGPGEGEAWAPGEGEDVYAYDGRGQGVSHDEGMRRPKGES